MTSNPPPHPATAEPKVPGAPLGCRHVASLNLFQEHDGSFWLTVASASPAVEEARRRTRPGKVVFPMTVLAGWIKEAAGRFVESWANHTPPRG